MKIRKLLLVRNTALALGAVSWFLYILQLHQDTSDGLSSPMGYSQEASSMDAGECHVATYDDAMEVSRAAVPYHHHRVEKYLDPGVWAVILDRCIPKFVDGYVSQQQSCGIEHGGLARRALELVPPIVSEARAGISRFLTEFSLEGVPSHIVDFHRSAPSGSSTSPRDDVDFRMTFRHKDTGLQFVGTMPKMSRTMHFVVCGRAKDRIGPLFRMIKSTKSISPLPLVFHFGVMGGENLTQSDVDSRLFLVPRIGKKYKTKVIAHASQETRVESCELQLIEQLGRFVDDPSAKPPMMANVSVQVDDIVFVDEPEVHSSTQSLSTLEGVHMPTAANASDVVHRFQVYDLLPKIDHSTNWHPFRDGHWSVRPLAGLSTPLRTWLAALRALKRAERNRQTFTAEVVDAVFRRMGLRVHVSRPENLHKYNNEGEDSKRRR